MKTFLIISYLAAFMVQPILAQTTWKEDWRTYPIEEVIKFSEQRSRGGWTYAKVIEVFGQPDEAVSAEDFKDREASMIYKLYSGLTFRIIKARDTDTKRYGEFYFATFQLIDPKATREDQAIIWTENRSRPVSKAEMDAFRAKFKNLPRYHMHPALPPTDTPSAKTGSATS